MAHKNIWRFIVHLPLSPAMNMAVDEAIAITFSKNETPPTLRLYQWKSPAITLGAFQKIDPILRHFLETNGVRPSQGTLPLRPVTPMRRITGGQALLHDKDLTYSIIASTHDPLFAGGIKKTFYSIAQGLLGALQLLGISAKIHTPMRDTTSPQAQSPRRGRSPFCASSLSWYEIAVDGKKLIGSAQKRWPDHFLQHGSIPLEKSPLEIENAIQTGFETAWPIQLEKGALTSEENQLADHLVAEKYNNAAWTEARGLRVLTGEAKNR